MSPEPANVPCPDRGQLQLLLAGELAEPVRQVVEDHVEVCDSCQNQLQHLSGDSLLIPCSEGRFAPWEGTTQQFLRRLARRLPATNVPAAAAVAAEPLERLPEIPGFHQWEWLGRGGAGEVYRAWQPELARWVAIKTLSPHRSPTHADRVLREAKILGRLSHPHIVQIYETGEFQGRPYLVLEWISGGSLQQRLQHGVLAIREAAQLGHQLALALAAVHALGIIHRDLKPANVLLQLPVVSAAGTRDERPVAKLTDFGIAVEPAVDERLTCTGQVLGTPHYMAPEQTGLAPHLAAVGPATDIYGLGAVLYAALTGQAPHGAESSLALLRDVASAEPRSPRGLRPEIPRDLETIVLKCLRHDPARRYRSAGELAEDLQRYLQGRPIWARPYTGFEKMCYWGRRQPLWGTVAALAALLGTVSLLGGAYHRQETRRLSAELLDSQQQVAQTEAAVQNERVESRRARWETLKQLTARSEASLSSGTLAPEQRRGTLETVRRHYRNRIDDLDAADPSTAIEVTHGLERLTALEEREGLLTQALADLDLVDRIVGQFSPELSWENHLVWRDLRRARVLIQLHRLPEAAAQMETLFERNAARSFEQNLLDVLRGVGHLSQAAMAQGNPSLVLPQLDQALVVVRWHLEEHPDDLPIGRGRFELLAQKLQVLDQIQDQPEIAVTEQEWLRFAREFASRPIPPALPQRIARLQLLQRMAELALARSSAFAEEILPLWIRDIAAFREGGVEFASSGGGDARDNLRLTHLAELVVQQVDCLTKCARLDWTDQPAVEGLPGWPAALQLASVYLERNPSDQTTRLRLAWSLVEQGRFVLSHDPQRSLEAAQEACHLVSPLAGGASPDAEGRQLLSDALYLSASARRSLGRLTECRQDLERAYLIAQGGNRDTIAADLVVVSLALGDHAGARRAAGWILTEGPQLKEARRLLGKFSTAQAAK